ncbi:MAG TPA: cell envelope integrity protein TolA [Noviherbaspirillum sp.]|nr:cell envelope integrity protein TolA [Noviherbaspirillum sp.]
MTDATPYTVPQEPGRWRAIILAALVHLALLAFLWIGVRWQNETPTTIEAEVWSPQPREAAPVPEPVAEKEPEPTPVIRETPREIPKPQIDEPPVVKPDIALEQEKKRKELEKKKRLEEEQLAKQKQLEQEKLAQQKKEREEREARLKKEEDLAKKKAEQERLAKQEAEKKEAEKKEKEKKAAEAKRKQEAEDKKLAKLREEEMRRLAGGVTGTGGSGEAAKSQGGRTDSGYAGRVAAKIKSNIVFNVPEGLTNNPSVEYEVNLLPDGSVAGMKKLKSSGVPGFDEAVRRAIEKSQPYPRDKSGSVPSSFIGIHRPKDQ